MNWLFWQHEPIEAPDNTANIEDAKRLRNEVRAREPEVAETVARHHLEAQRNHFGEMFETLLRGGKK